MNIIGNLNIGKRLSLGFAILLALSIAMTAISTWRLQTTSEATSAMMSTPLLKERLIGDWYSNLSSGIRRTIAIAKSSDPTLASYFAEEVTASSKTSGELQKQIEGLLTSEQEKALFTALGESRKAYLTSRDAINKAKEDGSQDEANRILDQSFVPAADKYQSIMRQLVDLQRAEIDATAKHIAEASASSRNQLIMLQLLVVAFGIGFAWYLTVGITRPLHTAVNVSRRVAEGDLTADIVVTGKDETGQLLSALQEMTVSLRNIVTNVRSGTDTIATASGQIAAGNLDLSSRTEEQASALEETASSMEELITTVRQNADNARQANQLAASASGVATEGGNAVSQAVQTMEDINESSKKIVDIISVIDGIAFQTNILALNAAVEAARAGEQGRGFAVVATEVRSLAQRSASAAKEIKELINSSVEKIDNGSQQVINAGQTISEIVASVKRVTDIVAEISAASQEQASGIEQINDAITQMDQVTQQNAALVEQAASAAASMQDQSSQLSHMVSVFKLNSRLG
jgi:methyl-accepting chemotaxis protein